MGPDPAAQFGHQGGKEMINESTRVYPIDCLSEFCGKGPESCPTCKYWPALKEFKDWVKRTGARPSDPIWCPTVYRVPRTMP